MFKRILTATLAACMVLSASFTAFASIDPEPRVEQSGTIYVEDGGTLVPYNEDKHTIYHGDTVYFLLEDALGIKDRLSKSDVERLDAYAEWDRSEEYAGDMMISYNETTFIEYTADSHDVIATVTNFPAGVRNSFTLGTDVNDAGALLLEASARASVEEIVRDELMTDLYNAVLASKNYTLATYRNVHTNDYFDSKAKAMDALGLQERTYGYEYNGEYYENINDLIAYFNSVNNNTNYQPVTADDPLYFYRDNTGTIRYTLNVTADVALQDGYDWTADGIEYYLMSTQQALGYPKPLYVVSTFNTTSNTLFYSSDEQIYNYGASNENQIKWQLNSFVGGASQFIKPIPQGALFSPEETPTNGSIIYNTDTNYKNEVDTGFYYIDPDNNYIYYDTEISAITPATTALGYMTVTNTTFATERKISDGNLPNVRASYNTLGERMFKVSELNDSIGMINPQIIADKVGYNIYTEEVERVISGDSMLKDGKMYSLSIIQTSPQTYISNDAKRITGYVNVENLQYYEDITDIASVEQATASDPFYLLPPVTRAGSGYTIYHSLEDAGIMEYTGTPVYLDSSGMVADINEINNEVESLVNNMSITTSRNTTAGGSPVEVEDYLYFVELETEEYKGTSDHDLVGWVSVGRNKGEAEDNDPVNVYIPLQSSKYEDGEAQDGDIYIHGEDDAVVEFDDDAEEVWIFWGEDAFMVADVRTQKDLNLGYNVDYDEDFADKHGYTNIDFLNFVGEPVFNRSGELYIYADDDQYIYELDDGEPKEIKSMEYDDDENAWVFRETKLTSYVITDDPLVLTDFEGNIIDPEPELPDDDTDDAVQTGKPIPHTGR